MTLKKTELYRTLILLLVLSQFSINYSWSARVRSPEMPPEIPSPNSSSVIVNLPSPDDLEFVHLGLDYMTLRFHYDVPAHNIQQFEYYISEAGGKPQFVGRSLPQAFAEYGYSIEQSLFKYKFPGLKNMTSYAAYVVAVDMHGNRSLPGTYNFHTMERNQDTGSSTTKPSGVRIPVWLITNATHFISFDPPTNHPDASFRFYISSSEREAPIPYEANIYLNPVSYPKYIASFQNLKPWTRYCISVSAVYSTGVESSKVMKCGYTAGLPPML